MWVSRLKGIAPVIGLLTLTATGVSAAAEGWVVESARGTALRLNGDQWEEAVVGELIADGVVFRTLQSGRIVLSNAESRVSLGGQTAVEVDFVGAGSTFHQFAGAVTVVANSPSQAIRVENSAITASATGTTFTVEFDGKEATVEVAQGTVTVADATGGVVVADAGDTIVSSGTGLKENDSGTALVEASNASSIGDEVSAEGDGNNGNGLGVGGNNGNGAEAGGNNGNGNNGNGNNGNGGNGNNESGNNNGQGNDRRNH
jgi:hypothetical protein